MSKKVKSRLLRFLIYALLFTVTFALTAIFYPHESLPLRTINAAGSWLGLCLIMATQRYMAKDREEMEAFAEKWKRRRKERQYPAAGMMKSEEKTK